jgi:hypothetical protein
MKFGLLLVLSLSLSLVSADLARADCTELYRREIVRLRGVTKGGQSGIAETTLATGIGTGAMIVTGTLIFPPVLLAGGAVTTQGAKQVVLATRIRSLRKVLRLLLESEAGGGPLIEKLIRKNAFAEFSAREVADWIRVHNRADGFCTKDEFTLEPKLDGFRAVKRKLGIVGDL